MEKNKLNVFTSGYYPLIPQRKLKATKEKIPVLFNFHNLLYNIGQFFRNIKYAWQRATKGYCDADVWSLDNFYIKLIPETIKSLKEHCQGHPGNISQDDWNKILDNMIGDFKFADACFHDSDAYNEHYEKWLKIVEKPGWYKDENLTEEEKEIMKKYTKACEEIREQGELRLREGFLLFKQYFNDLWW